MNRRLLVATLLLLPAAGLAQEAKKLTPQELHVRGREHFFAGRIAASLTDWDRVVKLVPEQAPHHWQRGIALYYAERYEDGVKQFESHQTVNPRDVENAVWHFLCAVRAKGGSVVKARTKFIPIKGDPRIPMKEVHDLFAGEGTAKAVLTAAQAKQDDPRDLRNHLCYAHLYLGLYYEATGETKKSALHMKKAAVDFKMDHYMGKVAQVHYKLRNAKKDAEKEGE